MIYYKTDDFGFSVYKIPPWDFFECNHKMMAT